MIDAGPVETNPHARRNPQTAQAWWAEPEGEAHDAIWTVVDAIESKQTWRWVLNLTYANLYENVARLGVSGRPLMLGYRTPQGVTALGQAGVHNRSQHNVIKSCVDTTCAKIAKNQPRVKFVTNEGSWHEQQRARKLTQYIDGLFHASHAYAAGVSAFRDSEVFDAGFLHPYVEPGTTEIKVERVIPLEIIVDELDGAHGSPRQMHRKTNVPRETLLAAYPDKAEEISRCNGLPPSLWTLSDEVIVIESWHLPSGPNARDGRHCLCISGCTLLDEPYEKQFYPFVRMVWSERLASFFGLGLCEELAPIQLRINKLDRQILAGQEMLCVPRVAVEEGSTVNTNTIWDAGIIKFRGTPPQFGASPGLPPEMYQERDREIERAYELSGVSQLSASAQKPAGLNSGAALREFQDQASERFSLQGKRYEEAFVELARIMIDMSRDLYAKHPGLKVKAKGKKFIRTIKWNEVDLDEDRFIMSAWPVSQLPNTPEGRLQFVQELAQAGYVDRDTALELLNILDIDESMSMLTAAFDDALMFIDSIIEDGVPKQPEKFLNLALTLKLSQSTYLRAQSGGAPEERLEMLRNFMDEIIGLQETMQSANTPPTSPGGPPGVGGGAPIAQAAPPPVSDLLPVGAAA